jgi:hypothetical protein
MGHAGGRSIDGFQYVMVEVVLVIGVWHSVFKGIEDSRKLPARVSYLLCQG